MKPAATLVFVIALAASGAAAAQGAGLRVGDAGGWIAPNLGARIGDAGPAPSRGSGMVDSGNAIAPYLGVGYGHLAGVGVNFFFDFGLAYRGQQGASFAGSCGTSLSSTLCAQYQSDAAAARAAPERSLDRYNLYPVGRVGVRVGF
jgi:hypothetical protein